MSGRYVAQLHGQPTSNGNISVLEHVFVPKRIRKLSKMKKRITNETTKRIWSKRPFEERCTGMFVVFDLTLSVSELESGGIITTSSSLVLSILLSTTKTVVQKRLVGIKDKFW